MIMAIHCPQKNSWIRYTYKTVRVNVESMSNQCRINVESMSNQYRWFYESMSALGWTNLLFKAVTLLFAMRESIILEVSTASIA